MSRNIVFTALAVAALASGALGKAGTFKGHGHVLELEGKGPGSSVVVERVLDGDTVIVRGWKERVRLANIDAPEMSHGYGKPGQPFSVHSSKWLTDHLEGKAGVTIRCVDEDRYGRQVCDFYRGAEHVNKEVVRAGLAWANTANPRYLRDKSVLDAQNEARAARKGIWSQPHPTPPWEWRNICWRTGQCDVPAQ